MTTRPVVSPVRWTRIALSVALLGGLVLWAAPTAHAVGSTLDFEDGSVADGTLVTTQFSQVNGVTGLSFGGPAALGFTDIDCNGADLSPTLAHLGSGVFSVYAHSGSHVLESPSGGCAFGEFATGAALLKCSVQCLSVTGWLGSGTGAPTGYDTVRGYDVSGSQVASVDVPIAVAGANNAFALTAPPGHAILWVKVQTHSVGQPVWLDDLGYEADPAALPGFTLVPAVYTPQLALFPGDTVSTTFSLGRFNGSTGTLTPTVTGLPAGVTATFTPSAFTGSTGGSGSLQLEAAAGAVPTGTQDIVVTATGPASAGGGTGGWTVPLHFDATAIAAAALPTPSAPDCTAQVRTLSVDVQPGYTGSIDFAVAVTDPYGNPPADPTRWAARIVGPTSVPVSGGRSRAVVEWVHRPSAEPWMWLVVTASVPGHPTDRLVSSTKIYRVAAGLAGGPPVSARAPLGDRQAGNSVSVEGWGLCPGSSLVFGNGRASAPATVTQPNLVVSPLGYLNTQTVTAATPRLATSGRLGAIDHNGAAVNGPALVTTGYRNTAGFAFHNYSVNDLTYAEMTDAFGEDQTYLHIDLCYPGGCTITVRDPVAMAYTAIVRALAVGGSGSGHCFGISLTAAQMRNAQLTETWYPPYNAAQAYGLDASGGPSAPLARTIQANHLRQFGITFIGYWLGQRYGHPFRSGNDFVTEVRDAIDHHGGALIAMAQGGAGHVVVATSVEDIGPNDHYIDVYDPNREYTATEDTDTTGVAHETVLDASRIHIVSSDWGFTFPDATAWSGRVGSNQTQIVVVPLDEASKRQVIPSMFDIAQLTSIVNGIIGFGSSGGSAPTATPGPGMAQYGADAWAGGGGLFVSPAGRGDVTLTGRGAGTVNGLALSNGTVTTLAMPTAAGRRAKASLVAGGMAVTPAVATPIRLEASRRAGASVVTTSVTATAAAGTRTVVTATAAGSVVTGSGALRLVVTSSSPRSIPVTRSAVLTVARGQTLTIPTASLLSRRAGLRVLVSAGGRSVARALPTIVVRVGAVTLQNLRTTRSGRSLRVVVVAAAAARPGSAAASLAFVVVQGRKVVSRVAVAVPVAARSVRRTFRAALRLPRSGTYRVLVSLALVPRVGAAGAVVVQRSA